MDDKDDTGLVATDPAVEALIPGVSAAALIEAMDDPAVIRTLARAHLYENMVTMRAQTRHPAFPADLRLKWMGTLAKWAGVEAGGEGGDGERFTININIPSSVPQIRSAAHVAPATLEAQ